MPTPDVPHKAGKQNKTQKSVPWYIYSVELLQQCQKRPIIVSKETYYSGTFTL
jgi:hypothetical protein